MTFKEFIRKLQIRLNEQGENLSVDGDPGPKTQAALERYDIEITAKKKAVVTGPSIERPQNPSYLEAKKYAGKTEFDSKFGGWLSGFWKKVGLPNYKTIIGSSFAWCALFVVAMQSETGQKYIASAAARSHAKTGIEINWKKDGIPRGAIVHLNNAGNCSSGSNNHVTFADGDCTAEELSKSGATFPGFGGNQGNAVKRSTYAASKICAVRWPAEVEKPGPVTKSIDCQGSKDSNESTR